MKLTDNILYTLKIFVGCELLRFIKKKFPKFPYFGKRGGGVVQMNKVGL